MTTLLDRVLSRATLKGTSGDPMHAWLVDALTGGEKTLSGERVSPSSALSVSAYYAAIRAISEDVGKLPLPLYQRSGRGKRRAEENPLYRLIHDEPNAEMSSQTFREVLTQHAMGWGNGYAEIVRAGDQILGLWPLDPTNVRIERETAGGPLIYHIRRTPAGPEDALPARSVFHLHGLGYDGVTGYSVARLARQTIGLAAVQEKSGAAYFGNANRPSGILETALALKPEQKKELRAAFDRMYGGVENAHRTAVLEGGITFKPISINNEDAQWLESRQFSVEEIARWFRIPPHKISHLYHATFNNIAHQSIEYVVDTLLAWLKRWEMEIWRKVVPRSQQKTLFAEHVVEGLLRGDPVQQAQAFATGRQWGYLSANDVLELMNRNPIGPQGDVYLSPVNMTPADQLGEDPEPEPTEPPEIKPPSRSQAVITAHYAIIERAFADVVAFEASKAEATLKTTQPIGDWAEGFFAVKRQAEIVERIREPLEVFTASLWAAHSSAAMPEPVNHAFRYRIDKLAGEYVARSREQLQNNKPNRVVSVWRDIRARDTAKQWMHTLAADCEALL